MTQEWNKNENAGEEDDVQMPLGVSNGDGAVEENYVGDSKPKINTSTLALFAAFGAALVVLYLLGLQNKPRAASAEDLAKQQAVTSAIDDMLQNTGKGGGAKIRGLLDDTSRLVQLLLGALGNKPLEAGDLPANPFEREFVPDLGSKDVLPQNLDDQKHLRELAEDFGKLKLQMVMMGAKPAAMIQNNLVTVGGSVGTYFRVIKIQADKVIIAEGKREFELKLDSPKGK